MPYLGNIPAEAFSSFDKQTITGNGGTSYTLDHPVGSAQEVAIFVNNVRQEPGVAYTVTGTALTMTGNVESSDDFYAIFIGKAVQTVTHPSDAALFATSGTFSGNVDIQGNELILDADGDTSITADTDDRIDFRTNGGDRMHLTSSGALGIGTTAPATVIHATKTSNASQRMRMQNGEGSADFGTDANRALVWVSGNQKFRIDNGGLAYLNSEGGSVAYVNVQQGSCKQWTNFNQTNHSTRDSYNQTSLTDNGTGLSQININNNMNNSSYSVHNTKGTEGYRGYHSVRSITAGEYKIDSRNDGGNEADATIQMCGVWGDQA